MSLTFTVKSALVAGAMTVATIAALPAQAADYVIDTKGAHASINFAVKHLGYSWLTGRFDTFSGEFSYDEKAPEASKVSVKIDTNSVNSNHAERDKHLRSADFLEVSKFPEASFESTGVKMTGEKTADITGNLTLHGVTKPVVLKTEYLGGGKDPWGGFRQGFQATTQITMADYGIKMDLGPAARTVDLTLHVEGVRK